MKTILAIVSLAVLAGCSSTPPAQMSQFCHTSKTIKSKDGTSSSTTELYCSDDPVERMMEKRAGLAYNCGEFVQPIRLGGRVVYERAISCQRLDGSWYVLPITR